MPIISTNAVGIDAENTVWLYVPPIVLSTSTAAPAGVTYVNLAGEFFDYQQPIPAGTYVEIPFNTTPGAVTVITSDGTTTPPGGAPAWLLPVVT